VTGIFDRITGQSGQGSDELHDSALDTGQDATEATETKEESGRTERALRDAVQELLRVGLLEQSHRPNLYRIALHKLDRLNAILEPLDLHARADEVRGLVFLAVRHNPLMGRDSNDDEDDWSHPLVRRQRLNLEQTLLVAILRQHYIAHEQNAGSDTSEAMVAVDDLVPQLQVYMGDSGSESRERNRALQLLDQLKGHGLVSAPDTHERVVIRPMITHLANPQTLSTLLHALKQQIASASETPNDAEGEA
jgi:hypothetical protein